MKRKFSGPGDFLLYMDSMPRKRPDLDLKRIQPFLRAMGDPQKKLTGVLVGGTNGKGSVCSMLESIIFEHGYKVGFYTSPHLINFGERIRVNKENFDDQKLLEYFKSFYPLAKKVAPTCPKGWVSGFELMTAAAFKYFADQKVDFAVVEVGMGGRSDATNMVDMPVNVITNVTLEHTEHLGKTIAAVATEKSGIIKSPGMVVTAARGEAREVIAKRAKLIKSQIIRFGREIKGEILDESWKGLIENLKTPQHEYRKLHVPLVGRFQLLNSGCAVGAAEVLLGKKLNQQKLRQGLKKTIWRGRFQLLAEQPRLIVDSAHNPDGMKTLVDDLKKFEKKPIIAIFSAKKPRDVRHTLAELKKHSQKIFLPKIDDPTEYLYRPETIKKYFPQGTETTKSIKTALTRAKKIALAENRAIVICGSILFLSQILRQEEIFDNCGFKIRW